MAEWPRTVYIGFVSTEEGEPTGEDVAVIPADLGREQHEAIGSCLWLMNNLHNAGTEQFTKYAKAAEEDARRALARYEREVGS